MVPRVLCRELPVAFLAVDHRARADLRVIVFASPFAQSSTLTAGFWLLECGYRVKRPFTGFFCASNLVPSINMTVPSASASPTPMETTGTNGTPVAQDGQETSAMKDEHWKAIKAIIEKAYAHRTPEYA